jgi:hypothetical protein
LHLFSGHLCPPFLFDFFDSFFSLALAAARFRRLRSVPGFFQEYLRTAAWSTFIFETLSGAGA